VPYVLILIVVVTGSVTIGYLFPMTTRDADVFGIISAATAATLGLSGCAVAMWLVLTRRVTNVGIEAFFSFALFGGFIWAAAFLLPKARRERDIFGVVCSIVAALLALAAWLLLGTGVQSA
jgi:hypothetical protein